MKWLDKCRKARDLKVALYEGTISYSVYWTKIHEVLRS